MKSFSVLLLSVLLYPCLFAQKQFREEFLQDDFSARPLTREQLAQQQFASQQRSPPRQSFVQQTTPAPVPLIIKQINSANEDGSYTFGYESQDGSYRVETKGADGLTRGKYGYIDATGVLREVEYSAGGMFGYEPSGAHIQVPPRPPPKRPGEEDEEYDEEGNPIISQKQRFQSFPAPSFPSDSSQFVSRRPQQQRTQSIHTFTEQQPQQQRTQSVRAFAEQQPQQQRTQSVRAFAEQQPQQQQIASFQTAQSLPINHATDFRFAQAQPIPASHGFADTRAQAIQFAPSQRQPQEFRLTEDVPAVAPIAATSAPPPAPATSFQIQTQHSSFQNQHSPLADFLSQLQQNQRRF